MNANPFSMKQRTSSNAVDNATIIICYELNRLCGSITITGITTVTLKNFIKCMAMLMRIPLLNIVCSLLAVPPNDRVEICFYCDEEQALKFLSVSDAKWKCLLLHASVLYLFFSLIIFIWCLKILFVALLIKVIQWILIVNKYLNNRSTTLTIIIIGVPRYDRH